MASGYALPPNGVAPSSHSHAHVHKHSRSYSGNGYLSPDKASSTFSPISNFGHKKAPSNGSLYTHAETSRETSPLQSPYQEHPPSSVFNSPALHQNVIAHQHNHGHRHQHSHSHSYSHSHSQSLSPVRRPRGDSDLGRNTDPLGVAYAPQTEGAAGKSDSWLSIPAALTSLLVPLPYLLASAAYSSTHGHSAKEDDFPPFPAYARPLPAYARIQHGGSSAGVVLQEHKTGHSAGAIQACALTALTLLVVGSYAKFRASERMLDRRKVSANFSTQANQLVSASVAQTVVPRVLGLVLPFYASMLIGGMRVGLILLVLIASDLTLVDITQGKSFHNFANIVKSRKASFVAILCCIVADFAGWTFHSSYRSMTLGYGALFLSSFVLPSVLPSSAASRTSSLISSVGDSNSTLTAGGALFVVTVIASHLWASPLFGSSSTILLDLLSVGAMAGAVLFSHPFSLHNQSKAGLGLGCFITASCAFLYSPDIWPGTICNGGLSALAFLGVLYDTNALAAQSSSYDHDHDHAHNVHTHHHHDHSDGGHSFFTKFLIARCEPGSLFHSILMEKDSRRIAYFTTLNFGFMFIQGVYGYLSGSLGLLSDTVHMFFDCLGLVVGLGAAVASKWPTSADRPYGWGKLNTLAGFGNGIFLMLVSVEFVWEAMEGIVEAKELRHVKELLVVSILGFLVNMIGLFAFGHAHAGHDHGHSHGHSHDHSSHDHSHDHGHKHSHSHAHAHDHGDSTANAHSHGHLCADSHKHDSHASHGHDHHNENMEGIFLHVAADAGGSLAVILSTAMTLWKPWYLWDPLATIIIAILIFAMAVPLVTSSGQKLLLVIPDQVEYSIKTTLQEIGEMRGVVGYTNPRFWLDDRDDAADSHGHHHHGHDHGEDKSSGKKKILGIIHIVVVPAADLEDVRQRVDEFLQERNMDLVVHVERESDSQCWCREAQGSP